MPKSWCSARRAAVFLLLIFAPVFSQGFFPNHSFVEQYNDNLVESSAPISLPSDVENYTVTFSSPFQSAYVRILLEMPSVDNRVSNLHSPSLIWAWGAQPRAVYVDVGGCDIGHVSRIPVLDAAAGSPTFNGTVTFSLANKSSSIPARKRGKIPIPPDLWREISVLEGANSTPVLPALSVNVTGKFWVLFREDAYLCFSETPGPNSKGCRCGQQETKHMWLSTPEISDSRNWSVEIGRPFFFLLAPIAGEQLSFRPKLQVLVFSSHRPSQVSLLYNGRELNSTYRTLFNQTIGELGEMHVESNDTDIYGINISGSPPFLPSNISAPLSFANGTKFKRPSSLDASNTSYAYQYLIESNASLPVGKGNATIYFRNQFDDEYNKTWEVVVRDASAIVLSENVAQVQVVDADANRRNSSARAIQNSSDGGLFSSYYFEGNDSVRPSSAFASGYQASKEFPWQVAGALAIVLAGAWALRQASMGE